MVNRRKWAALAAIAVAGASAAAEAPSPAVTWAGCAGVMVAKTMLTEDQAQKPRLGALARRALAQAKTAENPEKLTPAQIDGLAMSSGKTYLGDARKGPEQRAKLEKAAEDCTELLAKLPG
jgi:hypothetical protein